VDNSLNLDVKQGQIVKISVEKKVQVQQGFFALGLPIVGSFLGWFLAQRFYFVVESKQAPESVLVISVILGFTVFALMAVLIRSFFQNAQLPKITEILDSQS
jgi:positive regulator of sigma E activity